MWQWAHLLGFNLYWLLAVKWQQPGPLLLMLLLHFLFSPRRRYDWRLIPVALAGCLLDILLWRLGLFQFPAGFPLWLLLLWCGFALTLSHGLRWLRPCRAGSRRAVVWWGASSYVAGAAMGQCTYPGASGSARRCWR
ncbi:DUF2878 family protein [Aeromonas sp. Marseille-Q7275]